MHGRFYLPWLLVRNSNPKLTDQNPRKNDSKLRPKDFENHWGTTIAHEVLRAPYSTTSYIKFYRICNGFCGSINPGSMPFTTPNSTIKTSWLNILSKYPRIIVYSWGVSIDSKFILDSHGKLCELHHTYIIYWAFDVAQSLVGDCCAVLSSLPSDFRIWSRPLLVPSVTLVWISTTHRPMCHLSCSLMIMISVSPGNAIRLVQRASRWLMHVCLAMGL